MGHRPIVGAYHVALFPNWERIAEEQCGLLRRSGLLAATAMVLVGVVGDDQIDVSLLSQLLGEKAQIRRLGNLSAFEFPTQELLASTVRDRDCACWYIHTKGVSTFDEGAAAHRRAMGVAVVENHRACLELLDEYDACGTGWQLEGFGQPNPHFAGNFWWANARYIQTLPEPRTLHLADRYQAEFWIGKNPAIRPFPLECPGDPFSKPTAWSGLESKYQSLIPADYPIERIVDIGVDYGFSTFHFAKDHPQAEVIGVDNFTLHPDSEAWVRSHLYLFPNVRIRKGRSGDIGRQHASPVDLIHIDGDHAFQSVSEDFCAWLHVLRPGGCVLFHDIEAFESVRQFFDGLGGPKSEISEHYGLGCWTKT